METAKTLSEHVGVVKACRSLDVPRASYYRHFRSSHLKIVSGDHRKSPRGLSQEERQNVLDIMHSKRFVDVAPQEIYATLLDEGTYLCSVSTMYRILSENGEVRERRNQLRHPAYSKPELLATGLTRSGPGILPSARDLPKGCISTSMLSWISSAITLWAGWLHIENLLHWQLVSSKRPAENRVLWRIN